MRNEKLVSVMMPFNIAFDGTYDAVKWAVAREARRNPDFLFVARPDARETHDLDEAIDL